MVIAFYFICEQIEPAEPKLFKCRAACRTVSIIVVAWNKRYADDAVALPPGSDYQAEVGCHKVVGLPGVALVYAGIHVLYVYYERVYHRNESLHPFARHIERSLYVDAPRRAAQFAEVADELWVKAWLAPAECNAPVRGQKV